MKRLWKDGIGTLPDAHWEPHPAGLGRPQLEASACDACGDCVSACPTDAIALTGDGTVYVLSLSYAACVSCGRCALACHTGAWVMTGSPLPIAMHKDDLVARSVVSKENLSQGGESLDDARGA